MKPWYKSLTVWVGMIAAVLLGAETALQGIPKELGWDWVTAALAIIAGIKRFMNLFMAARAEGA